MSKRVADLLVETLETAGVRTCYGIIGDTLNRIAHAIDRSEIDWVHMRHEEAGAFAAQAEALLTGRLTACAGSCGPGSLHFINGLYEANRNRAPVILIATQIVRQDIGFQSIQEIDFNDVFKGCSIYCEMIMMGLWGQCVWVCRKLCYQAGKWPDRSDPRTGLPSSGPGEIRLLP